jgi:hypothetical protein
MADPDQKTINGLLYERWKYQSEDNPVWMPVDDGAPSGANYVCNCGSTEFNVFSPQSYTTSVRCVKCGCIDEVHTG